MVEYSLNFDDVFGALRDGTRRDMLARVMRGDLTISELAGRYRLTFAAIAKHVDVLLKARLVFKRRQGREQVITGNDEAVHATMELLRTYEQLWTERLGRLGEFLEEEE